MKKTDLIAMRDDLGLGHKGNILITTQEKVDHNLPPIATSLLGEEWATCIVNRVNQHDTLTAQRDALLANCKWINKFISTACDGGDAWCSVRKQPGASEWAENLAILCREGE